MDSAVIQGEKKNQFNSNLNLTAKSRVYVLQLYIIHILNLPSDLTQAFP